MADRFGSANDTPVNAPAPQRFGSPNDEPLKPSDQRGALERFVAPAVDSVKALFKPSADPHEDARVTFGKNVINLVKSLPEAQQRERDAMHEAWNKGDHVGAVAHGLAALTPILGPLSQDAADKWVSGDHAGALGTAAFAMLPEFGENVAAGGIKGAKAATAAAKAAAPHLGAAAVKGGLGAIIEGAGHEIGVPGAGAVAHGLAFASGMAGMPDLIRGIREGARAGREALAEKPSVAAPPPENPAVTRVLDAFDPATARQAPPTTAPGNAVYEHGPVDIPKNEPIAPGPPGTPRGTASREPLRFAESGREGVPLSAGRVGPRQIVGGEQGPLRPSSGLSPMEGAEVQPVPGNGQAVPGAPGESGASFPVGGAASSSAAISGIPDVPRETGPLADSTSGVNAMQPQAVPGTSLEEATGIKRGTNPEDVFDFKSPHPMTAAVARKGPKAVAAARAMAEVMGPGEEPAGKTTIEPEGYKVLARGEPGYKERAQKIGEALHNGGEGIPSDVAESDMKQEHWDKVTNALGLPKASENMKSEAIAHLRNLEAAHEIMHGKD